MRTVFLFLRGGGHLELLERKGLFYKARGFKERDFQWEMLRDYHFKGY